ncbi:protocadherin-10-like [Narcine bancroftii]|uniref:protocadherin-10-like n=1 Tax=Narcine bancroftii TaxID=1343680 RepID=UPI003831FA16
MYLLYGSDLASGQVHYSVFEELDEGAFVGNIAQDLGLNIRQLSARKLRLTADDGGRYMKVSLDDGLLCIHERIDREHICGQAASCAISFEIILEYPLEVYRGEVEILDINDNSPMFRDSKIALQMSEVIAPGTRFPLKRAQDPDIGINTIADYAISFSENFSVKSHRTDDGIVTAELILDKHLDRELQPSFQLILTATDGGVPPRSGTAHILITVLDNNDNPPVFDQEVYRTSLSENGPLGTLVMNVKATDLDEGLNAELTYSFSDLASSRVRELFILDRQTGEIRTKGPLDFEEASSYSLDVQAVDHGSPAISGHAKVLIKVIDTNDNSPDIKLISTSIRLPENALPGTLITLFNVIDHDSGENGEVQCDIPKNIPFRLQSSSKNHYKLFTSAPLDRESVPEYKISLAAWDLGSPSLSSNRTIQIIISDVNDNTPRFAESSFNIYVTENNTPGTSIFAVTATDLDEDQNSLVSYSFLENFIQEFPVSAYLSINSMNGTIYALRSFDYEATKTFRIYVEARDAGVPRLSSTASVNVIVLDQNDNAPVILSHSTGRGPATVEIVPQSAGQGYVITKIKATDSDSGQNARLSYQMLKSTDPSLFDVRPNSGEIRMTRTVLESDATTHSLVVLVKDNGQPSLSSTVTIPISISENITDSRHLTANPEPISEQDLYLMVLFGCTSVLFLVIIILLIGVKCAQDRSTIQGGYASPTCCYKPEHSADTYDRRFAMEETLRYSASGRMVRVPEEPHYSVCLSPESAKTDFLFLKPRVVPTAQAQC